MVQAGIVFLGFFAAFVLFRATVQLFLQQFRFPIAPNVFAITLSIILALVLAFENDLQQMWFNLERSSQQAITAYVPVFVMSIMCNMDSTLFRGCLLQAIALTLSTVILTPLIIGVFFTTILYSNWSYAQSVLFSLIAIPLEPQYLTELFEVLSSYSFLGVLYQLEAVLLLTPVAITFHLICSYRTGVVQYWYHFCTIIARALLGGLVVGLLAGVVQLKLLVRLHTEPTHAVCASVLMTYGTYLFAEQVSVSAPLSITCMSIYIVVRKHRLEGHIEEALCSFWNMFYNFVEMPMLIFAMTDVTLYAILLFDYRSMYTAIFLYVVGIIDRMRACLMLIPVFHRMSHTVDAKSLFVLSWSGVRGTLGIDYLLMLIALQGINIDVHSYLLSVVTYVLLSNVLNCSTIRLLLKSMGLMNLTTARLAIIYNCMTYLVNKQLSMLCLLKANRYLSNVNWEVVRKKSFFFKTYIQEASEYHKAMQLNEEQMFILDQRVITCPDCHNEFRNVLTAYEMNNLQKKNYEKMLKIQRISFLKQYENGAIDKDVLQLLLSQVNLKLQQNQHKKSARIQLSLVEQKNPHLNCLRVFLRSITDSEKHRPPTNNYRRLFFYLVFHVAYDLSLNLIIILNAVFSLSNNEYCCRIWMVPYHVSMCVVFLVDVLLRWISCKHHGELWMHILHAYEFVLLIFGVANIFMTNVDNVFEWTTNSMPSFRLLAALHLLSMLRLCRWCASKLANRVEQIIDKAIACRYALVLAWTASITDLLLSLGQIVVERMVRDSIEQELQTERMRLQDELAAAEARYPWLAITVKTKQVVRITLTAMESVVAQMAHAGYVDAMESVCLHSAMREAHAFHRRAAHVQPHPLHRYFSKIAWMPHAHVDAMQHLYAHAVHVYHSPGEILASVGVPAANVYVIIAGELLLRYVPEMSGRHDGRLPLVDYLSTTHYGASFDRPLKAGDAFGMLSVITRFPYDCTITAITAVEAYRLPGAVVREAARMNADPISGLEALIWRYRCENLAIAIMREASELNRCTEAEMRAMLSRAFMPNLRPFRTFVYFTPLIAHLLLVSGSVVNADDGEVFVAPLLIPSHVSRITLVHSRRIKDCIEVKLLIIPHDDILPVRIMMQEEDTAELFSNRSELLTAQTTSLNPPKADLLHL